MVPRYLGISSLHKIEPASSTNFAAPKAKAKAVCPSFPSMTTWHMKRPAVGFHFYDSYAWTVIGFLAGNLLQGAHAARIIAPS